MLRIKQTVQFHIAIFLLVLAALSGGISVFAADETIIYGSPVPSTFDGAAWDGTSPDPTLPNEGTYKSDKGTLVVKPRPITITPDSKTKTAGTADPVLTYTVMPKLGEKESLTGALTRVNGETVGSYSILQGDLTNANNSNYDITFISGQSLVITAASSTFDVKVTVKYGDSFSSSGRMPDQSYGYSAVSGLAVTLYQETPSKDASLQFEAERTGGVPSSESVTLYAALPSGFSKSKEYYIRRTHEGSDSRLTAEIERHGDYYYVVFTTSMLDNCTFRVIRKSSGSSGDRDDGYTISSFWEDVIDDIIDAENGDRIRVKVGTRTNMAAEVLRELRGLPITLSLIRSNGQIINIYGKDIGYLSSSRDYFTLTSLANEYGSSKITSAITPSAPVQAASSAAEPVPASSVPEPSSSAAPSVPCVARPAIPAQTWTPPPQSSSSIAEISSSSLDEPSSSLDEPSSESSEMEESDIEIMAEEEPSIEADGSSNWLTSGSAFFPLFVVGSLSAAGILAGIITVSICHGRKNSR